MIAHPNLYGHGEWWEEHWRGMPEFDQRDLTPEHSIEVGFVSERHLEEFAAKLGQRIPNYTKRTTSLRSTPFTRSISSRKAGGRAA